MATADQAPSPADQQKLQDVAQAGAAAAAQGPPEGASERASEAMRAERDRVALKMSDEDIDRVAAKLTVGVIDGLRHEGAFDPPPEPVRGAPATQAPPAPGEDTEPAAAGEPAPAPRKLTFAHRFMGVRE